MTDLDRILRHELAVERAYRLMEPPGLAALRRIMAIQDRIERTLKSA